MHKEGDLALPSAVEPKLLVYQNAALRRQLEVWRSETEKLKTEVSDCRSKLGAAELVAAVALGEVGQEEVSKAIRSFAGKSQSDLDGQVVEEELAKILDLKNSTRRAKNDAMAEVLETASFWRTRCIQNQTEVSKLEKDLEISRLEVQRLNLLKSSLLAAGPVSVPTAAAGPVAAVETSDVSTDTEALRAQVAKQLTTIAALRSEIAWRRSEGYESLLGSLRAVHEDRTAWRAKAAEVEEELRTFRSETSESLTNLTQEFTQTLTNFRMEISTLQTALTAAEVDREAALATAEAATTRLDAALAELEAMNPLLGNFRADVELLKTELAVSNERCDRLQAEVDLKETSVSVAVGGTPSVEEWQKKYRELRAKFDAELDYRSKLKEANMRLKTKLAEEKDVLKQVERLNEVLRQKDEAHNKLMALHMTQQQLMRQLREREEAVNQRSMTIETTLNKMHTELVAAHGQVVTAESAGKEKELEVQVTRVEKENLVRQLSASQQSNSQLENALAKMTSVVTDIEQDLREAMTKNFNLNREMQRLQRKSVVDVPPDMLQLQLAEFRAMVKCSLCNENFKDVMLTKCAHCFCRSCVHGNLLNARNRKCPLCGTRFAESDVKPVHLTQ